MTSTQVESVLTEILGGPVAAVEALRGGAWSAAFGFEYEGRLLVIRFADQATDFRNDERAQQYRSHALPIPGMLDIGRYRDRWYAVSERVLGAVLEDVTAEEFAQLRPAVLAMLDALRTADVSGTTGYGGWARSGNGISDSWRGFLLVLGNDIDDPRGHGRMQALRDSDLGDASFRAGRAVLSEIATDPPQRSLLHGDLLHHNVLTSEDRITGVFDWGCAAYGDPIYEAAWFEFWAPWHQGIDADAIVEHYRSALEPEGVDERQFDQRLRACLVAIGLDHLTYNAAVGSRQELFNTDRRLAEFL